MPKVTMKKLSNFLLFYLFLQIFIRAAIGAEFRTIKEISDYPQLGDILVISGDFVMNDIVNFDREIRNNSNIETISFNSNGGLLNVGIEIGRRIRSVGLNTFALETCASACALSWIAGRVRFANEDSRIGFHVAYLDEVERRESGMANAVVGLYLGELGFGQNVVQYATSAPPDQMQWLTSRDAFLLGIDVQITEIEMDAISPRVDPQILFDPGLQEKIIEYLPPPNVDQAPSVLPNVSSTCVGLTERGIPSNVSQTEWRSSDGDFSVVRDGLRFYLSESLNGRFNLCVVIIGRKLTYRNSMLAECVDGSVHDIIIKDPLFVDGVEMVKHCGF